MSYVILEARIEFDGAFLKRVTVLVQMSPGDIRAIFVTNKPANGYMWLLPSSVLSPVLLQEVAAYGMETVDRDEIFPKWRKGGNK